MLPGPFIMAALTLGIRRATPRSAIFSIMAEFRSTFAAVRSRWMIGWSRLCRKNRPCMGHVVQNQILQAQWDVGLALALPACQKQAMQIGKESFRNQRWCVRAWEEDDAQELDNVRMTESAHQLIFPDKLSTLIFGSTHSPSSVCKIIIVQFLDCAGCLRNFCFQHLAISSPSKAYT